MRPMTIRWLLWGLLACGVSLLAGWIAGRFIAFGQGDNEGRQ